MKYKGITSDQLFAQAFKDLGPLCPQPAVKRESLRAEEFRWLRLAKWQWAVLDACSAVIGFPACVALTVARWAHTRRIRALSWLFNSWLERYSTDRRTVRIRRYTGKGGTYVIMAGNAVKVSAGTTMCTNMDHLWETSLELVDKREEVRQKARCEKVDREIMMNAKRGSIHNKEWFHRDDPVNAALADG